jgi:hypothetical protein
MRRLLLAPFLILAIGCSHKTAPTSTKPQEYIDGWAQMGMWLPDQEQIEFFRSHWLESEQPLTLALKHPAHEVRMRAGYVIEKLGSDALPMGLALTTRLQEEPDRLVRMYLYDALQAVRFDDPSTVAILKEKFESLDENNQKPEPGESNSDYLDADEMIRIAGALYVLDQAPERQSYLEFILKWLRPPKEQLTPKQIDALWERRWGAVLTLEGMTDAGEAIPLLEALQVEESAPAWVSIHVPRVLESIR